MLIQRGAESNIDPLKPFAGTQFIIRFVPGTEPMRAAEDLSNALKEAGWQSLRCEADPAINNSIREGVLVEKYVPHRSMMLDASPEEWQDHRRLESAVKALVGFLKSNKWEAKSTPSAGMMDIPANTIHVSVGFKPTPYFLRQDIKDLGRKLEQEAKERWEKIREQYRKDRESNPLPPWLPQSEELPLDPDDL